jgi:DNA-binding NarL/FixJ family response regulator
MADGTSDKGRSPNTTDRAPGTRDVNMLIVEDDAIVRSWIRLSLRRSEFRIIAEAATAADARELAASVAPDVWLIDYRLPDQLGTVLLRDLRQQGVDAPAMVVTAGVMHGFNELVRQAGGQGSALKTGSPAELLAGLRAVAGGKLSFDARHPTRVRRQGVLTPREREVLALVGEGATNVQIATTLGIGTETVKTMLARAFVKLGVNRRAHAVSVAHERGIL